MQKDLQGEVNPVALGDEENLGWGYSWSPLVDGDQLVCYPGGPKGAVAALDLKSGAVRWRSTKLKEQASYASPIVAEIGGVRQYIVLHNNGLAGVAAKNGELLWTWAKKPPYGDVVIPTPIYHDGHVYISAGYTQATCDLVKISADGGKFKAEKAYATRQLGRVMKNMVGGSVLVDGHVYGHSNKVGWVCQNLRTGKEVWAEKSKFGPGSIAYADGHLYCHGEDDCAMVLIEASPTEWKEKGRFPLPKQSNQKGPSGRNWTPPVIANGHLFVRDQEYLFCYKIK
jgi:outer membrane protein assembly factor BamB